MARTDAPGPKALRGGGGETQGDTHAGAPELQVSPETQETCQEGTRRAGLAAVRQQQRRHLEVSKCPNHASHHVKQTIILTKNIYLY